MNIFSSVLDVRADKHARANWAMGLALAATALLALAGICTSLFFHNDLREALRSSSALHARKLIHLPGLDSWSAMFSGLNHTRESPGQSPYRLALERDHCKYQYPPSSLLLLEIVGTQPGPVNCETDEVDPRRWRAMFLMSWAQRLTMLATIFLSILILQKVLVDPQAVRDAGARRTRWVLWLLGWGLGLTFYPLTRGFELGQVQLFLNLFVALALWSLLHGRHAIAGALIGLCCLFKPQYALMLLWSVWRRDWRFALSLLAVAGSGLVVAVARYGLTAHLQYIEFLRMLSRHGEAFWANQTVNGLLNRLLGNGDALNFSYDAATAFPPYNPLVYTGTLMSSVLVMMCALVPVRGTTNATRRALDFAVMSAALVIASPIGWEHHFGGYFPLFALGLGLLLRAPKPSITRLAVLGLSYLAVANFLLKPDLMLANGLSIVLYSHMLFGALALFGLLVHLRHAAPDVSPRQIGAVPLPG